MPASLATLSVEAPCRPRAANSPIATASTASRRSSADLRSAPVLYRASIIESVYSLFDNCQAISPILAKVLEALVQYRPSEGFSPASRPVGYSLNTVAMILSACKPACSSDSTSAPYSRPVSPARAKGIAPAVRTNKKNASLSNRPKKPLRLTSR